jgi:acyl-CoA reductase-like NAD-dependent aldehyde dehydrogenase
VYDQFVAKAAAMANSIKVGPQFDGTSQQGPQVDDLQFKSVMRYIELGKTEGAKVLAGGGRALEKVLSSSNRTTFHFTYFALLGLLRPAYRVRRCH